MAVLALDTATSTLSVAVVEEVPPRERPGPPPAVPGVSVLGERAVDADRRHAELLAPTIRDLLRGGRPDRIVVGVGPGPFTGLRVGVATARALGQAWGVPVDGVCSLDACGAAAAYGAGGGAGGEVVVVTDARRREVYTARYRDGRRISGPAVVTPAQLADELAARPARVVGEGARRYPELLGPGEPPWTPSAVWLVAALVTGAAERRDPLPAYLRRPDVTVPSAALTPPGPPPVGPATVVAAAVGEVTG